MGGAHAFPLWEDSIVDSRTAQGIYYTIYDSTPNRTVVFEYYTRRSLRNEYCHFQVLFFEANPGIVQFIYLDISESCKSATIGVQGKSSYE
jgi:hypothetical protein